MERRSTDRLTIDLRTTCRVPATPHSVTVVDVSHSGCRLRFGDTNVVPGTTIYLDLQPAASVSGQVAWVGGGNAGVRFHRRLGSELAVPLGIEEAAPVSPLPELPSTGEPKGLQHWIRRFFGLARS
jgi:hypothetical protein